jgi:hypothetical protein
MNLKTLLDCAENREYIEETLFDISRARRIGDGRESNKLTA